MPIFFQYKTGCYNGFFSMKMNSNHNSFSLKKMVDVKTVRDGCSLVLSLWASFAAITVHEKSFWLLSYFFILYFLFDLTLITKYDFQLHHVFGLTLCIYSIVVDVPNEWIGMVYNTELSTPMLIAVSYLPKPYTPIFKVLFIALFYVTRVHLFGMNLTTIKGYKDYPNYAIILLSMWGMYLLNLFWFVLILKRIPNSARLGVAALSLSCFYYNYRCLS